MTRQSRLADLRRLYHHLACGGEWDRVVDTARLSLAIAELEKADAEIAQLKADRAAAKAFRFCGHTSTTRALGVGD